MKAVCAGVLAVAAAGVVGCTTTHAVPPGELARLDGYDVDQPGRSALAIQTVDGPAAFDEATRLQMDLPGSRIDERFAKIRVSEGALVGQTRAGEPVHAPLDQIRAARLERNNVPLTMAFVAGVVATLLLGSVLVLSQLQTSQAVAGRPLRVGGKPVMAAVAADEEGQSDWQAEGATPDVAALSPDARAALAATWTESARAEHASVPAFSRLSMALMAVGAPARLVEAAHRAALDEIEHARAAFALASSYSGAPVAPGELAELRFEPAAIAAGLPELAEESLLDGCLNEGLAAAVAADAGARAGDPVVRETLAAIARDEAAHAELGWEIVAWCCDQSGVELHRALRRALRAAPAAAPWWDLPADLLPELSAHGWPGTVAFAALAQRTRDEVATRLEQLVFRHDHPPGG